jgi:hypothetical protein
MSRSVIADARRLGLSRRRFSPTLVTALCVLAGAAALGVTVGGAHYMMRDNGEFGAAPGLFLVTMGVLCGIAGKVGGERDTPAGRAAAARWLGVRAWLDGHESFVDLPPAAVAVWDRYLPYGAALGVTRVASQVIDLGMADRKRIWSSYTGGWRQVSVSYPRAPRYGQRLGWIVFRAVLAALIGWTFASPRNLWPRLFDSDPITVGFTLTGLALLGYGTYTTVRVLLDLAAPTTVSGEVLWHQLWQTHQQGTDTSSNTVPVNFYLVIDDGHADRTRAWVLPASTADRCGLGDTVTARIRPWTRRVLAVTVQRAASRRAGPHDIEDDEELVPAAGNPGAPAAAAGVLALDLAQSRAENEREDKKREDNERG